jgi:hypothetical protein
MDNNQQLFKAIESELRAADNCSCEVDHRQIAVWLEELVLRRTGKASGLVNGELYNGNRH